MSPDNFAFVADGLGSRQTVVSFLGDMSSAVAECYFHLTKDTDELRAIGGDIDKIVDDFNPTFPELSSNSPKIRAN